jgi:hypothetical protein
MNVVFLDNGNGTVHINNMELLMHVEDATAACDREHDASLFSSRRNGNISDLSFDCGSVMTGASDGLDDDSSSASFKVE